jgi:hypothetical protein
MRARLLAPLALAACLTTACLSPAQATKNVLDGIVSWFQSPAPTVVTTKPDGSHVDCTVLVHYPDHSPIPSPSGTGWQTHIAFTPWRTDPTTWNTYCHRLPYVQLVKINGSNLRELSPGAVVVSLKPMYIRVVGPGGIIFQWVGDGWVYGRMDVTDFLNNYLIGRPVA